MRSLRKWDVCITKKCTLLINIQNGEVYVNEKYL